MSSHITSILKFFEKFSDLKESKPVVAYNFMLYGVMKGLKMCKNVKEDKALITDRAFLN